MSETNLDGMQYNPLQCVGSPGTSHTLRAPSPQRLCVVCEEPANGIYFGALVCLACKSFYIRCTRDGQKPEFCCAANGQCLQEKPFRLRCQHCRFQKCLKVGMVRKERPVAIDPDEGQNLCRVCGYLANGVHFGIETCEGCKKFFRRGLTESATYICKSFKKCAINPKNRNDCRYCRYQKCLAVGMSRDAIKMGRPKKHNGIGFVPKLKLDKCSLNSTNKEEKKEVCHSYSKTFDPKGKSKLRSLLERDKNENGSFCGLDAEQTIQEEKELKEMMKRLSSKKPIEMPRSDANMSLLSQHSSDLSRENKIPVTTSRSQMMASASSSSASSSSSCEQSHFWVHNMQSVSDAENKTVSTVLPVVETFTDELMEELLILINQQQSLGGHLDINSAANMVREVDAPQFSSYELHKNNCNSVSQDGIEGIGSSSLSVALPGARRESMSSAGLSCKKEDTPVLDEDGLMSTMCQFLGISSDSEEKFHAGVPYDTRQISRRLEHELQHHDQTAMPQCTQWVFHERAIVFAANHSDVHPSDLLIDEFLEEASSMNQPPDPGLRASSQSNTTIQYMPGRQERRKAEFDQEDQPGQIAQSDSNLGWNWSCHSLSGPRHQTNRQFLEESYWFNPSFSQDDQLVLTVERKHLIDNTVKEYNVMLYGCDEEKLPRTQDNANFKPQWPQNENEMGHWRHVQRRIVRNTMYEVAFAMSLDGFRKFHHEDILQSLKFGTFQSITIFASVKWFLPAERQFRNFWNWTIAPENPMYYFKLELLKTGELIHMLKLDDVETSLMCALTFLSPDWHNLKTPEVMERARKPYVHALLAHIQDKYCHGIKRLQMLLALMPQLRYITLWHHHLMKNMKVTKGPPNSSKK